MVHKSWLFMGRVSDNIVNLNESAREDDCADIDEATSSADTRTEVLVQKAMAALGAERTSFVIAHRLSAIRDADLILVMDH